MKLTYDWQRYDGDYQKKIQDIKLKNGDVVMACYLNAGHWMCLDSKSPYYEKQIHHLSAELVRLNAEHNKPFEKKKKSSDHTVNDSFGEKGNDLCSKHGYALKGNIYCSKCLEESNI